MANGVVSRSNNDRELLVYGSEAYYEGPNSRLRYFTYRVDGFVSVSAGDVGGELLTKSLTFSGKSLVLNYATKDGSLRVELQSPDGKPLPGFTLADCKPLAGDEIRQTVEWRSGADISGVADKPVRLRFSLQNADVYSLQFTK